MTTISLQNYLDQIDKLIDESKLEEAIAHSRHILMSYPRNIAVYKLLGKAHLELRHHDEAIDLFQRVLSADPNDLVAHIALSMIYKEQNASELSLWHLERAFEIEPYNEAIREELRLLYVRFNDEVPQRLPLTSGAVARLYIRGELYQQAVQTLQPVVAEAQDRLDLEVLLAEALWQGRDDQRIDAEKVCLDVLERLPNSVVANSILATIWLRTGRVGESQKYLARVQDLACLDYKSLDAETPIGRAFATDGAPKLPQEITLQWLDNMPVPEQVQLSSADWMSEMDADLLGEPTEADGEVVEEAESGMHSYDWIMDVDESDTPDLPAGAMVAGAVMTDWFAGEDESGDEPQAVATGGDVEEVPDWLGDLSDGSAVDEDADFFLDSDPGLIESDGSVGTNWFTDEAIGVAEDVMLDSDVPDWLSGLDDEEDGADTAVAHESTDDNEEALPEMSNGDEGLTDMPDWLAAETGNLDPLPANEEEDSPDWLGDPLTDELEPIQMSMNEANEWLADESDDEVGVDMIKDNDTEEGEDDFDFLDMLADGGDDEQDSDDDLLSFDALADGEDGDEDWLAVNEEDDSEASAMSDWLLEADEKETDTAVAEESDIAWLNDSADTAADAPEDEALASVTSWLSDLEEEDDGLGDLADAEPDMDIDANWLNETSMLLTDDEDDSGVVESVTSWLSDLEDDGGESDEAEAAIADEVNEDWLQDTNLLENVGKAAVIAAATAGVADWLSDEEDEDGDGVAIEEDDLFADVAMETDTAVADDEERTDESNESDWLAELPESTAQAAVAGKLGSDWLTEDGDDDLFGTSPDVEDSSLEDILAENKEEPEESADDWLSVLTQDEFDTSELEEMTPEIVSEYESSIDLESESDEVEDWSALMYGTDALAGTTLDETGDLLAADFPTALSEDDLQNSEYEDIPDWLKSGPIGDDNDNSPIEDVLETAVSVDPGDMLDEDDLFPALGADSDWKEEEALDWITDLSESEGGTPSSDDKKEEEIELSPDITDFDDLIDKPGAGPISTAELLGLDDDQLPDWMEDQPANTSSIPEPVNEDEIGLFADGLLDELETSSEEVEDTLSGMLGWASEDATDDTVVMSEGDDLFAQLEALDDVDEDEIGAEISATEIFTATDLFADDKELDDFVVDEDDEAFEVDGTGLTGLLAGTSLGQSGALDPEEESFTPTGRTTAEFESDLPDLLSSEETNWLDQLGGIDESVEDASVAGDNLTLDWLAQTSEFSDSEEFEAENLLSLGDEEVSEPEQTGQEVVDIGEDAHPEDINEAISWLEDLATQQDTPIEELPSVAQNVFEDDLTSYLEEGLGTEEEEDLDWLTEAEPIALTTPPLTEDAVDVVEDTLDLDAPPEDLDGAMAWLGELTEQKDEDDDPLDLPAEDGLEELVPQTDSLAGVQAELDSAMSWLDEIATDPDESEIVLDEAEVATLVAMELDEAEEVGDPELADALDWLEQQVLAEGISVVIASENAPTVSDMELDSALLWLEEQLTVEATLSVVTEDAFVDGDVVDPLPVANMLTGSLDDADVNLFAMPDDPTDALAWLESMDASGDDLALELEEETAVSDEDVWEDTAVVETEVDEEEDAEAMFAALLAGDIEIEEELPAIKPSEDAVYVDESLYASSAKPVVEEPEVAAATELSEEEEAEALFAALLAGDIEIEEELPAIKPSEDAVYVDESLYASSKPSRPVVEEPAVAAATELSEEEEAEAMFAALMAGDIEIEEDLPAIKPSEDAVYVDESLYASSQATDTAVSEDIVEDVPNDPDEAVAWLEAMAHDDTVLDIETDLPPIKPSEDAVYTQGATDTAVSEDMVEDVPDDPDEAVAWLGKMADQQTGDVDSLVDDEDALPSWMSGAEELDDNFDDILEEDDISLPVLDANATPAEILNDSLGSPIDADVHESLPSWLEVDQDNAPIGGETGWLRTLADLDVDSWLAAEEEATVRGFEEPTPLPVTSELSPTPSITSELGILADEPQEFDFDMDEEGDEFLVVEPDSSVSMYSIDDTELKIAQDALAAEKYEQAAAKYHELVSKGGGIMILIAELETAAANNPDHPEFCRLLGDAYMRNGQLQKALDTYKDALNKL